MEFNEMILSNKMDEDYKVNGKNIFRVQSRQELEIKLKDFPNFAKIVELVLLLKCMYFDTIFIDN